MTETLSSSQAESETAEGADTSEPASSSSEEDGQTEDLTAEDTAEDTSPETTLPEESAPETTIPETTIPETTIPETTFPETTLPEDDPAPEDMPTWADVFVPYDVPLTLEQQQYAANIGKQFYLMPEMLFGIMYVESRYNVNAVNGKCQGIMQVHKDNIRVIPAGYGVTDLFDYNDCVLAACYFLLHAMTQYSYDPHIMLLYYHCAPSHAGRLVAQGITQDNYTRAVMNEAARIMEARRATAESMGVRLEDYYYDS